ncbi:MAG: Phosphopantothenoylcysteine decarboxylase / Phosphopantothenoylcysteine synthetase [uncultured bacterium]|nr:MAG: Phosphopantothenoylcysteine decarboxylase / Phosphopantothenoylcysteine synthetase [uncultured bacterium]
MRNEARIKNIVLGVTGSIAAYKSAEIIRLLIKNNFNVRVIMTDHAKQFIHPNTLSTLSHHTVYDEIFDSAHSPMMHIDLARWADIILIAPATASIIGKLSAGFADDLLTTACLATTAKIVLAPAMNKNMLENVFVKENIIRLKKHGVEILDADTGEQACGDYGEGRMQSPEKIVNHIINKNNSPLNGKTVLITAGPTVEPIDPVRFISNYSSGKMGYCLAETCYELGAKVILISGLTALSKPTAHHFISITTADEMHQAVMSNISHADIFIGCAAVADYKSKKIVGHKIKKSSDDFTLELTKTKDIVADVASLLKKPFTVGFCLETDSMIENAKSKLIKKRLDAIVANQVRASDIPFNSDENEVTFISKELSVTKIERDSKKNIARKIMALVCAEYFLHANHCESQNA